MRKRTKAAALMIFVLAIAGFAPAQEESVDRVTVELTDPSEPVFLAASLVNGGITVSGYEGDEVIVEAKTKMGKIRTSRRKGSKGEGMTRIPVNSSSLTVEEYNNKIEINTDSWANPVDLVIKVPYKTSLGLSCVNQGDIYVENIEGDLEISNTNGKLTLLNINGSVVANALNQDITVTFTDVDPDKDMSFSSLNGDIDVTFPASLKAKVKIKSTQGEVFSDFEVEEIESPERIIHHNRRDRGGKYQVNIDRSFWGLINGGGQVIQFSNFNGNIYIRKGV